MQISHACCSASDVAIFYRTWFCSVAHSRSLTERFLDGLSLSLTCRTLHTPKSQCWAKNVVRESSAASWKFEKLVNKNELIHSNGAVRCIETIVTHSSSTWAGIACEKLWKTVKSRKSIIMVDWKQEEKEKFQLFNSKQRKWSVISVRIGEWPRWARVNSPIRLTRSKVSRWGIIIATGLKDLCRERISFFWGKIFSSSPRHALSESHFFPQIQQKISFSHRGKISTLRATVLWTENFSTHISFFLLLFHTNGEQWRIFPRKTRFSRFLCTEIFQFRLRPFLDKNSRLLFDDLFPFAELFCPPHPLRWRIGKLSKFSPFDLCHTNIYTAGPRVGRERSAMAKCRLEWKVKSFFPSRWKLAAAQKKNNQFLISLGTGTQQQHREWDNTRSQMRSRCWSSHLNN